jgi:hypothetical protein
MSDSRIERLLSHRESRKNRDALRRMQRHAKVILRSIDLYFLGGYKAEVQEIERINALLAKDGAE